MKVTRDLEPPFTYSWSTVYILIAILILVILAYVIFRLKPFFYKKFAKAVHNAQIPNLKRIYIHKLEKLKNDVNKGKIENREAYVKLSVIIREFIQKTTGLDILSLSRKEAQKLEMKDLGLLMDEYYPPEFSKYSKGDIINSIERTSEVIKKWNSN